MACGRSVQQGTYLLFMVCSIFIALPAEATNLSPAETVCRAALKQSLQAKPVTTGSPASAPIAVLCKPLQDGTANSLALALLPAASAGTPSSDHRVWYDLYWLVLDHQQRPVVKQMFRQILRSPHDSDKGELRTTPRTPTIDSKDTHKLQSHPPCPHDAWPGRTQNLNQDPSGYCRFSALFSSP